jgi:RNA polymerase sigma factor (sigma-70 family)
MTARGADADGPRRAVPRPSREEIEALFARNLHHVRAFVRLRIDAATRDMEAISDIVQSACREVLARDGFEYRGEVAFRSYLCEAALHKIQNRRRHHRAQKRAAAATRPLSSGDAQLEHVYRTTLFDPQRAAIRAEDIAQLEAAFDLLPDDYSKALTLYRIVGLPLADVARQLGRTESATQTLLSRAMARLTSVLRTDRD